MSRCLPAVLVFLLSTGATLAAMEYTVSWIGNTQGIPEEHILQNITDLAVTPDGKVVATTGWDEGGTNVAVFQNGTLIGRGLDSGTGGWGRGSNAIVAAGADHFYFSIVQGGGYGGVAQGQAQQEVKLYAYDGKPAAFPGGVQFDKSCLEMVTSADCADKPVVGLAVIGNELFVADTYTSSIKVYQLPLAGQQVKRSWPATRLGRLDADQAGCLWMLQPKDASGPAKLVRSSAAGVTQPQQIILPDTVQTSDFCVDRERNRILVTNAGVDQNILIFSDIATKPKAAGTFGVTGGIFAGVAGVEGPLRFNNPAGVGVDKEGNIYVACSGTGLECYSPSGSRLWAVQSLLFVDCVGVQPGKDNVVYGVDERFEMDYGKTRPGSEWSYKATTLNRFKYPQDGRVNGSLATVFTRVIDGKTILYMTGMYGEALRVYRFNPATDGEIAIPCALFGKSGSKDAWPPHRPQCSEWLWVDGNGDGSFSAEEFTRPASADTNTGSWCWYPDERGTVWTMNAATNRVRSFPCMGLDRNGTPVYRSDRMAETEPPAVLTAVNTLLYDQPTDVMYLSGYSTKHPTSNGYAGGVVGHALVRINGWSTGNRTPAWEAEVPMDIPKDIFCKSICMAGDYLFAVECRRTNTVHVFSKATGAIVSEMNVGPAVGSKQGWVDIPCGISAHQRSDGEYLVFVEDDGFLKNIIYRMKDGVPHKPGVPSFSPRAGTFDGPTTVTITCAAPGATIRYTIDGSDPSATAGAVYAAPLTLSARTVLKAIAISDAKPPTLSAIACGTYTITTTVVAPAFPVKPEAYASAARFSITCGTDDASIRYTTDGSLPTATTGTRYSGPVTVTSTTTVRAIALRPGMQPSPVTSATYTISDAVVRLSASTGDVFLTNGDAKEWTGLGPLPYTYTLYFDHPVEVERLALCIPSGWGGPVDMTAEILGGTDSASTVRLAAPKVYAVSGGSPATLSIPPTRLRQLQIVVSASHNGQANLSEVELYGHNLSAQPTPAPLRK